MPTDLPYTIADLARLTGLSVRTIRYYLAQGLLPASGESGPGAHYGQGHLDRLRLTKRLQEQHLPLAAIRDRLAAMTDDEVAQVAAEPAPPEPAPGSALEYVRRVLHGGSGRAVREPPPPALLKPYAASRAMALPAASPLPAPSIAVGSIAQLSTAPDDDETQTDSASPPLERSQWERLSLGPNVELHVRRPLSRHEQKRVERLITIARQVLKEGKP